METPKTESEQLPIQTLKTPHREILIRATANVLSSPIAKQTYAQIVDGLPLSDVALDAFGGSNCSRHPLLYEHKQLCPRVAEEAEQLCSGFDVGTLLMPSKVRNQFTRSPLFKALLITRL